MNEWLNEIEKEFGSEGRAIAEEHWKKMSGPCSYERIWAKMKKSPARTKLEARAEALVLAAKSLLIDAQNKLMQAEGLRAKLLVGEKVIDIPIPTALEQSHERYNRLQSKVDLLISLEADREMLEHPV